MSDVSSELDQDQQPAPGDEPSENPSDSGTEDKAAVDQNAAPIESTDGETGNKEDGKKSGFERRVAKLTAKAREAEQEREYWKKLAMEGGAKPQPATESQEEREPTFEDYNDINAFGRAMSAYAAKKAVREALQERDTKRDVQSKQTSYQQKVAEFKKVTPDFDEVFADLDDVHIAPELTQGIVESDLGPQIAYYLAQNLDVVDKLNRLPAHKRLVELGKLEARLEKKETPAPVAPKTVSSAPAPQKTPNSKAVASDDFEKMTPEEWIAARNKRERTRR
jgi:hypothetical protein